MRIAMTVKLQNGALVQLLQHKGWTQADLARACQVNPTDVGEWMAMRKIPQRPAVRARIEAATGCLFEDLFPPELAQLRQADLPRQITVIRDMQSDNVLSAAQRLAIASPECTLDQQDRERILRDVLETLAPKEARVLRMRFGLDGEEPQSLTALGEAYGVSRERIAQIERTALWKLRQPSRRRLLADVWDYADVERRLTAEEQRATASRVPSSPAP